MHYKNGREAKAGDHVVQVVGGSLRGILYSTNANSDSCNGRIAAVGPNDPFINIKDLLHIDDIAAAQVPDSTK